MQCHLFLVNLSYLSCICLFRYCNMIFLLLRRTKQEVWHVIYWKCVDVLLKRKSSMAGLKVGNRSINMRKSAKEKLLPLRHLLNCILLPVGPLS
uniref:Uncharacterized protein n=1 Tax=Aegilops tauschii subsp. strangulata TaxID=200361 RepID=A0A453G4A2_AEGTS